VVWGGRMPNAWQNPASALYGYMDETGGRWQEVARHANIVPEQ
jgi:hypothetical protein